MGGPGSGRRPAQPVSVINPGTSSTPLFERLLYPLAKLGSPWQRAEGIAALFYSRPQPGATVGYQNYLVGCYKGELQKEINVTFTRYAATRDGLRPILTTLGSQVVEYKEVDGNFGLCLVRLYDETSHHLTIALADNQAWGRLAPLDKVWTVCAPHSLPLAQPVYLQAVNYDGERSYSLILPDSVDTHDCHLVLGVAGSGQVYVYAFGGNRVHIASPDVDEWVQKLLASQQTT